MMERTIAELRPPGANGFFRPANLNDIEIKRYLHDQLLRDTDVFSMAHSIEVRVPCILTTRLWSVLRVCRTPQSWMGRLTNPHWLRGRKGRTVTEIGSRPRRGLHFGWLIG